MDYVTSLDDQYAAGLTELGELLHTPRGTVGPWFKRRCTTGFPEAWKTLSMGNVFDYREVVKWYINWTPAARLDLAKTGHVDPELLHELGLTAPENGRDRQNA